MKKKSSSLLIILILLVLGAGFYWYGSGNLQGSYESARVGMPDLVVDSISKDSVGRVSISLTNKGTVDTPAKGLIAVFQDSTTKPKWSYNWQDLTKETMLKAGASTTLTLNVFKPAAGLYNLKVCADYASKLVESDETNNCLTQTFFVEADVTAAQVNDATTVTSDFQDDALDGTFNTFTGSINTISSGGFDDSAFIRLTSMGRPGTDVAYTFNSMDADLSGYKGISYWCRASDAPTNTVTALIDDKTDPDKTSLCSPAAANTWTFVDMPFNLFPSTSLDSVSEIRWLVTDKETPEGETYDIDRIVLY